MPIYNKLVRDLIPDLIEASGKKCEIRILEQEEYLEEIKRKMQEEALEFKESDSRKEALEELADILELVYAAIHKFGVSNEQLEQIRAQKKEQRGGFSKGIYLMEVEE
ncbi:nucleoside triphosphate pyrophosphohydrolase [Lysinibacillus sp. NPDC047702]|uniref:nucleoside triphosphate pyrophosphohydrolase n=1 Tax=unclassified Lysinibacillus TaxID=2636778 RepID=UPI003D026A8B